MFICVFDSGSFTPYSAVIGGVFIGIASSLLLLFNGRICGISGIVGQLIKPKKNDILWRIFFVVGLLSGGLIMLLLDKLPREFATSNSLSVIIIAGVCVGFGTRLGSGCTSGHGVCGISRFSLRSIFATITFMLVGIITTYIFFHFMGITNG